MEEAEKQQREDRESKKARRAESSQSTEEVVPKKDPRTERSESKIDTEGGGEAWHISITIQAQQA